MEGLQNHQFIEPRKIITSKDDFNRFKASRCCALIGGFIAKLQESIRS